jgi:flagellar protein FliJ
MPQSLLTLLQEAERQRDASMAAMLQAEDAGRRLRAQQLQLQEYHADYAARAPGKGGRSAPIDVLRSHHVFMQRLDQALAQQQGLIDAADENLTRRRQHLVVQETRVASVRKLLERRMNERQQGAARLEQKRSDEAAMQRHWRDSAQNRTVTS